jgi:mRNA interferase MazF
VIGEAEFDNLILCQITSKADTSKRAIPLKGLDFASGSLQLNSFIRPDKLFTVEGSIIETKIGYLKNDKTEKIKSSVRQLFN